MSYLNVLKIDKQFYHNLQTELQYNLFIQISNKNCITDQIAFAT